MNITITPSRLLALLACLCFVLGFFNVTDGDMDQLRWALAGLFFIAAGIVLA